LSLIGIMYSPDPSGSVAVVSTGGVTVAEDGTMSAIAGNAYNLKVGDRIGNTTIVQIRRDAVVVDVEVFDAVERHTMNFVSRRQGGTQ
jgi:ABC-type enterochelin transport system substrate-binding protein